MNSTENIRETIIIVDDNLTSLNVTKNNLKEHYTVFPALSGDKLFELLENVAPDMILLDVLMPSMNGYEIAKALKSNKKTEQIPIIFLTSKTEPEDEVMGLNLGAVDYITKPISRELLIKRVGIQILVEKQKKDMSAALDRAATAVRALEEAQITTSAIFNVNPQGNILFDYNFKVIDCNLAAVKIMGFKTKEELVERFYERINTDSPEIELDGHVTKSMLERVMLAAETGSVKYEIEIFLGGSKKNGIIELKKIPYEGRFAVICYVYDITDIREREKEIALVYEQNGQQLAKLNMAMSTMKMIIWDMNVDKNNPISPDQPVIWSDDLRRLLGYCDENDFPNRLGSLQMCMNQDGRKEADKTFREFVSDKSDKKLHYDEEIRFVTKNGETIYLRATGIVHRDKEGNPVHFSGGIMDITERKTNLLNNELQIRKLNAVINATKIAPWEAEVDKDDPLNPTKSFIFSDKLRNMLGYTDENDFPNTNSSFIDCLHPDDKNMVVVTFENHLLNKTGDWPSYDVECRMRKKTGEYLYCRTFGETIRDENGDPMHTVGALMDINEEKNNLLDKELQLRKLKLMMKASKIVLWDMPIEKGDADPVNDNKPFIWSNDFRNLLGFSDENDFPNGVGSFNRRLHPDDKEMNISTFEKHLLDKTGKTPYDVEVRLMKKNGEYAYYRASGETLRDKEGNAVHVAGALIDITETKMLIHEIDRQRLDAQTANEKKNVFLANMSHEMRTPLNAILGLSELSLGADRITGEDYSNLEKIKDAGMTLLNIVNDILDISKITTGKFELIPAEYDTPSLINDAVTQSCVHIGEKPVRFVLNIDEDLPARLYGDELRIKQVLSNLLSNAFKYTMVGKVELTIGASVRDDSVWLTAAVRDTGIGVRAEDISGLFDDYVQMDMSSHRKIMGTGLGLPIAKKLAESMSGCILVESEYGKGSVFTMRVKQKYVSDEVIGQEVAENLRNFNYSKQKRTQGAHVQRISLPYARVLVVDDMATNLDVAKGLMKRYNMKIDCLNNGKDAIELVREEEVRYNAIFMDHMMPGMDGIEATRQIRELGTEYAKKVPIIAFTANAVVGNEEMFLNKGFQAFISKPIEIARLDAVIREWVRDKEQEKLYAQQQQENGEKNSGVSEKNRDWRELSRGTGLDIAKGIARFGGDEDAYMSVLKSYARNTPGLLETAQAVNADYTVIVHGIKGSSRSICAEETADLAEALEKASKNGDFDYVYSNNAAFIETAVKLLTDIEKILEQIRLDNPKAQKDRPNNKTLSRLCEACVKHEMDEVDEIIAGLDAYEYETGGELVEWLKENAEQMNYDEIAEKLSAQ